MPRPPWLKIEDLAGLDARAVNFDWSGFDIHFVESVDDRFFNVGYDALWREFGDRHEMETRDVIAQRLAWRREQTHDQFAMLYEMAVVTRDGEFAGVSDQAAIFNLRDRAAPVIVHFSHLLVASAFRGTGLAAWMRTLPIGTARRCVELFGTSSHPITIVAEVEPDDGITPERAVRLRSFEKAGYRKVDPQAVMYLQPDFDPPEDIDRKGGPTPLPLALLLRRIGRESESHLAGTELRDAVAAVYSMYERTMRPQDMRPNWSQLETYPRGDTPVALSPPTRS